MKTQLLQILTLLLLTACSPNNPTPHHNSTFNQASTKSGDIISASDVKS